MYERNSFFVNVRIFFILHKQVVAYKLKKHLVSTKCNKTIVNEEHLALIIDSPLFF